MATIGQNPWAPTAFPLRPPVPGQRRYTPPRSPRAIFARNEMPVTCTWPKCAVERQAGNYLPGNICDKVHRSMSNSDATSLGRMLKSWRTQRQYSQLKLAELATISAKHLSFVE